MIVTLGDLLLDVIVRLSQPLADGADADAMTRLGAGGQAARTVTTKVRYPDFAIRSRSASLPVGTDDAGRIGELACSLLDRALRDRPGALRLVGVGVSNFEPFRQLALPLAREDSRAAPG